MSDIAIARFGAEEKTAPMEVLAESMNEVRDGKVRNIIVIMVDEDDQGNEYYRALTSRAKWSAKAAAVAWTLDKIMRLP